MIARAGICTGMLAVSLAGGLAAQPARVAEVRWGPDAYDELVARTSPDVLAAIGYFPRLRELLAGP